MTVVAILQARMSSTRLPGKVLAEVEGKAMLARQLERIQRSRLLDEVVVATSRDASDLPLVELCAQLNIRCFTGSLSDVLGRFLTVLAHVPADHVVRLTGDCPLTDWRVIDQVIDLHLQQGNDYTSNTNPPSFPDGLDVEVIKASVLLALNQKALSVPEREHVTLSIYNHPDDYKIGNFTHHQDLSHLRWTVDYPDDLSFVQQVFARLYRQNPDFAMSDILQLLQQHPDLQSLNADHLRNEALLPAQP